MYRKKTILVRKAELDTVQLQSFKTKLIEEKKQKYCWFNTNFPNSLSTYMGFDFLGIQQSKVLRIINIENYLERRRLYRIYLELIRRKRKYNSIIQNNTSYLKSKLRQTKKYKKRLISSAE